MAYRSSGRNNDEMVDNLKRFGLISDPGVEAGIRLVDRKIFVPKNMLFLAHADQPLKEANVHLSAPHIYASALEALELRADSCMSFLNIGSGTGYFSAIVAAIMGPKSTNYGVEIHDEVVQYSQNAISKLKSSLENPSRIPPMHVLHGNALHICPFTGEASRGFDRIYIGASVEHAHLSKLTCLLKVGGILVGPVEDELVKVIRVRKTEGVQPTDDDFSQKVISGVRFAALLSTPVSTVIIPAKVWEPNAHHLYPDSFRNASKALLLCCNAEYEQPPLKKEILNEGVNLAAMLPKVLWMEILSFTHRDWFDPPPTEVQLLKQRLFEEQENSRKAKLAKKVAEERLHTAERERDVYRLLARRWQARLQSVMREQRGELMDVAADSDEDNFGFHFSREQAVIFGLGAMLRGFERHGELSSDDDDDEPEQMDEGMNFDDQAFHEEDSDDDGNYAFSSADEQELNHESASSIGGVNYDQNHSSMSPGSATALPFPRQARAVSINIDDL